MRVLLRLRPCTGCASHSVLSLFRLGLFIGGVTVCSSSRGGGVATI
jgi:hypothetical protein